MVRCHFPVNKNYSHHPSHHHNLDHTWLPTADRRSKRDGRKRSSRTESAECSLSLQEYMWKFDQNMQRGSYAEAKSTELACNQVALSLSPW